MTYVLFGDRSTVAVLLFLRRTLRQHCVAMRKPKTLGRRPRNFRVFIGGVLAIIGLPAGMAGMQWLQHEQTMRESPAEVTYQELMKRGPRGNSLVRITGVTLGGSVSRAEGRNAVGQMGYHLISPQPTYSIIPVGGRSDATSNVLLMRGRDGKSVKMIRDQLAREGAITGHVGQDELLHSLISILKGTGANLQEIPELNEIPAIQDYPYVFRPTDPDAHTAPMKRSNQAWWLMACCLYATALGLVIAGSGAPSFLFFFLFPLNSLVCLPGYLLRYGRGNSSTRFLYVLAGVAMMGGAYYLTFLDGKIRFPSYPIGAGLIAYCLASFGCAAVMGAGFNLLSEWSQDTPTELEAHSAAMALVPDSQVSRQIQQPHISSAIDHGIPIEPAVKRYHDPMITISSDDQIPETMTLATAAFHALDFEMPLLIDVAFDGKTLRNTIQVGCNSMVLAITNETDGSLITKLFSVLENGQVVVTLSPGSNLIGDTRSATGGIIWEAASDDARTMLASHLDKTAGQAESFATQITTVHPAEWRDLYAYGHRVLADIGHQFGDSPWKVHQSNHGRFRFPVQPVEAPGKMVAH